MVKCLVTGSRGYIGENLVEFLRNKQFEVVEYDKEDDILNMDNLRKASEGCKFIYNCAAISGIGACDKDRELAYDVNVMGACNVVTVASEVNAKPILFSSRAIYGNSYYGQLKKDVEKLENDAVILRLSNVFGGKGYKEKKKFNAINRFSTDNPIVVYGGSQSRDFVHIDHVLRGCLFLGIQKFSSGIYDICSNIQTNIGTLALIFSEVRGVPIKYEPVRD